MKHLTKKQVNIIIAVSVVALVLFAVVAYFAFSETLTTFACLDGTCDGSHNGGEGNNLLWILLSVGVVLIIGGLIAGLLIYNHNQNKKHRRNPNKKGGKTGQNNKNPNSKNQNNNNKRR
ncbi:MAG: hypothetical protein FWE22_02315 [Firmicutes bacterium]|nr:hypothetical protein [Bacillota bacterium]